MNTKETRHAPTLQHGRMVRLVIQGLFGVSLLFWPLACTREPEQTQEPGAPQEQQQHQQPQPQGEKPQEGEGTRTP